MNKPLFLFVGRSSSGKTTIANMLHEEYGLKQIWSYTTRPPRYDNEPGHIFISESDFDNLGELAAYTLYNNYRYGTTFEQLNDADIYVVDVPGVETLLDKLKDDKRPIHIFYFDVSVYNRILRMSERGDNDQMIVSRLLEDEKFDWFQKLNSIVWNYNNIVGKQVELYNINANGGTKDVISLVRYYMNKNEGWL